VVLISMFFNLKLSLTENVVLDLQSESVQLAKRQLFNFGALIINCMLEMFRCQTEV